MLPPTPPPPQQPVEVKVTGENIPPAINTWAAARLPKELSSAIVQARFFEPTPVQQYAVPILVGRRDLMATAQTGLKILVALVFSSSIF